MPNRIIQKKVKFEFELTIDMEQIGDEHMCECESTQHLLRLKSLQQALMLDKPTLEEQIMAKALGKLQEYIDYLVDQDNLDSLDNLAGTLKPEDREFFQEQGQDFSSLTRPLRSSTLSVHIDRSSVVEQLENGDDQTQWRPIWSDLFIESDFGKQLKKFLVPKTDLPSDPHPTTSHHLLACYLTQRSDGIYFESRCTCGKVFKGVGMDEDQALGAAWKSFQKHLEIIGIGQKIRLGWQNIWKRAYGES